MRLLREFCRDAGGLKKIIIFRLKILIDNLYINKDAVLTASSNNAIMFMKYKGACL